MRGGRGWNSAMLQMDVGASLSPSRGHMERGTGGAALFMIREERISNDIYYVFRRALKISEERCKPSSIKKRIDTLTNFAMSNN